MACCRGPTEEVERILRIQKNYYAVLKVHPVGYSNVHLRVSLTERMSRQFQGFLQVKKDTPTSEVRANYKKASR